MARARKILSFLLLALWLPATSHCDLERAGVIESDDCCATPVESTPVDHPCADACDTLEAGNYKLPASPKWVTGPTLIVFAWPEPVVSPPEIRTAIERVPIRDAIAATWQFDHRAALPVRAPSFVS